jgi:hypothetical protein
MPISGIDGNLRLLFVSLPEARRLPLVLSVVYYGYYSGERKDTSLHSTRLGWYILWLRTRGRRQAAGAQLHNQVHNRDNAFARDRNTISGPRVAFDGRDAVESASSDGQSLLDYVPPGMVPRTLPTILSQDHGGHRRR